MTYHDALSLWRWWCENFQNLLYDCSFNEERSTTACDPCSFHNSLYLLYVYCPLVFQLKISFTECCDWKSYNGVLLLLFCLSYSEASPTGNPYNYSVDMRTCVMLDLFTWLGTMFEFMPIHLSVAIIWRVLWERNLVGNIDHNALWLIF